MAGGRSGSAKRAGETAWRKNRRRYVRHRQTKVRQGGGRKLHSGARWNIRTGGATMAVAVLRLDR